MIENEAPRRLPFVALPVPMPTSAVIVHDTDGKPLSITVHGQGTGRIRADDLATVHAGMIEYQRDRGTEP